VNKKGTVYAITNKITGRIHFGVTTRDGEVRLNEHRLALANKKERNKSLQREYCEIGEENFSFEIIIETNEHALCELVLIELFSRIGLGYKQRRGNRIQKVLNGEETIPESVYQQVEKYIYDKHSEKDYFHQLLEELQDIKSGFECKSKEIYNREFKNHFLAVYKTSTRRVDEVRFKKAGRFEEKAQKDLYDFTFEKAEEFLYSLHAKSLRSIQNHISRLGKYLDFAIQQGRSINKVNYYKHLGKKENASKYLRWKNY